MRERGGLRNSIFDLHQQVGNRELLARLRFDSGAVWVSLSANGVKQLKIRSGQKQLKKELSAKVDVDLTSYSLKDFGRRKKEEKLKNPLGFSPLQDTIFQHTCSSLDPQKLASGV